MTTTDNAFTILTHPQMHKKCAWCMPGRECQHPALITSYSVKPVALHAQETFSCEQIQNGA